MNWLELLIAGGTGAGGGGLLWRVLRSRTLRKAAAGVIDPDPHPNAIDELRVVLDEQRRGYEHLTGRVQVLENTISDLETKLNEEQNRAKNLQRQLTDERRKATKRVNELEKALASANDRIAHLEQQLEAAQAAQRGE